MTISPSQNYNAEVFDEFAVFLEGIGFPSGAGRLIVYLMICEPIRQSASDIQHALGMSVGSVSANIKILRALGTVKMSTVPGDRRRYYYIDDSSWKSVYDARILQLRKAIQVLDKVEARGGKNSRITALRSMYTNFLDAMEKLSV